MSTATQSPSSPSPTQERIKHLRQSVADATRDLCSLHCGPPTTVAATTTATTIDDRASFDLGLSLFGSSSSSIQTKLDEIEEELRCLTTTTTVEGENVPDNDVPAVPPGEEVDNLRTQLVFLRGCQVALDHLHNNNNNAGTGTEEDLVQSAKSVRSAREAVPVPPPTTTGGGEQQQQPKLLKSLHAQVRSKHADVVTTCRALLDRSIVFDRDCVTVTNGKMGEAYEALGILAGDDLEMVLRELASNLYRSVCHPVITDGQRRLDGAERCFRVETKEDGGQRILQWSTDQEEEEEGLDTIEEESSPWCATVRSVTTVLQFVHDAVLPTPKLRRRFGHYFLGSVQQEEEEEAGWKRYYYHHRGGGSSSSGSKESTEGGTVLKELLALLWGCIPSTVEELLSASPALRRTTSQFETDLTSMSFLDNDVGVLSDVTNNMAAKYAEKRRRQVLAKGRSVLMGDYYNTVIVGQDVPVDDSSGNVPRVYNDINNSPAMSIFKLPKMAISAVASKLLTLVRDTLDEATATTSTSTTTTTGGAEEVERAVQPTLYRTSRELLDLYRAIVPSVHGHDVSTIPRCAAVFHNDCTYLAHHLSTLGIVYRDRFTAEPLLKTMCTFVDMVPTFRELANGYLGEMVERHKVEIVSLMDEGGGRGVVKGLSYTLRMNEGDVSWGDAETALRGAEYHLKQLSNAWRPTLSRDVYCRAMGNLVDTVFTLLLDPVLKADDVSESASHFITSLFGSALQSSSELFVFDGDGVAASIPTVDGGGGFGAAGSASPSVAVARSSCDLWDRLTAVCRFMDMSLSDVSDALAGGLFRSVTGPELARLIRATFTDSEKREKILLALSE